LKRDRARENELHTFKNFSFLGGRGGGKGRDVSAMGSLRGIFLFYPNGRTVAVT
jgi:hypothetical protein